MTEVIHPPALSLPIWPLAPEPVDAAGTSFLIICFDEPGPREVAAQEVARAWTSAAELIGPTTLAILSTVDQNGRSELAALLSRCRTGVRIMIVGGQHDVLAALAVAREHGASPSELRSFTIHTKDLSFYCAHCRSTYRGAARPADHVVCPGCQRTLEVHCALNSARGSFLAAAVHARDLP
jgi:hypothetical protein